MRLLRGNNTQPEEKFGDKRGFSVTDKQILRHLLANDGKISTRSIAEELKLSRSTVQRRRDYMEKNYLVSPYILSLTELGYRRIDFLLSTHSGKTVEVANRLLEYPEVTFVGRSVGEHTIDLRAEIVVKDNAELLDMLERVKGMDGVTDAVWSEIVDVIGRKPSVPDHVINNF